MPNTMICCTNFKKPDITKEDIETFDYKHVNSTRSNNTITKDMVDAVAVWCIRVENDYGLNLDILKTEKEKLLI